MTLTSYSSAKHNPYQLTEGSRVDAKVYGLKGRGATKVSGRITQLTSRSIEGTEGVVLTVALETDQGERLTTDLRHCEPNVGDAVITSLRTAQFKGSRVVHALPEGEGSTTLCGRDASGQWIGDGRYNIEQEVTCRSCARSMLANPQPVIEITTAEVSYHAPADHSECEHDGGELTDNECDSVGGRWLDGDRRYLSDLTTTVVPFDPASRAEHDDLFDYVRFEVESYTTRGLSWSGSDNADSATRRSWLNAVDQSDITETATEYSLHIYNVAPTIRAALFRSITAV